MGLAEDSVQCVPESWAGSDYKVKCLPKIPKCNADLDIVLIIDGSGSLGQKGWKASIKAADMFIDAFSGTGAKAKMSTILYSGPSNYRDYYKCARRKTQTADAETLCKVNTVSHLTSDIADVKKKVNDLKWPKGSTFTSMALLKAKQELNDNGNQHTQSVVVMITDGKPQSAKRTWFASRELRKIARLVVVPVTRNSRLIKLMKMMATRRWKENLVNVRSFADLEKPEPMGHVVADICPGGPATAYETQGAFGHKTVKTR
jgi:hypothetical protein